MAKFNVGETVTYQALDGTERTGEVWSFGSQNAQRWVTTPDREFALLTWAKPKWYERRVDGLREISQDWRGELAAAYGWFEERAAA